MNKAYAFFCRAYQTVFRAALPILPYREPVQLDGLASIVPLLTEKEISSVLLVTDASVRALGLTGGLNRISCPTCGRCRTDLISKARALEKRLAAIRTDRVVNVALMGCAVNGPGEAAGADLGCACGNGDALLFVGGKTVGRINENEIEETLVAEVEKWLAGKTG